MKIDFNEKSQLDTKHSSIEKFLLLRTIKSFYQILESIIFESLIKCSNHYIIVKLKRFLNYMLKIYYIKII